MAEAEDGDPITRLMKSAISLQIPKEVFKHLKKPSFRSIIPDNERDRIIHFNACEQVEFYWESELGSDVPVWARKGDFTLTLPKGMSAVVAWGQYILDEVLRDEEVLED
ncbi:hypothetical protein J3E69DRAFT_363462 [Trichoderma sp. SZMC 28015]